MAFELFTPDKAVPRGDPMVTITGYGRISLNKAATYRLEKETVQYVQLLWDEDTNSVGITPADKSKSAFKLSYGSNGNGAGFSAINFLNYIKYDWEKTRNFAVHWNAESRMYIFSIDRRFLGMEITGEHLRRKEKGASEETP